MRSYILQEIKKNTYRECTQLVEKIHSELPDDLLLMEQREAEIKQTTPMWQGSKELTYNIAIKVPCVGRRPLTSTI